MSDTQLFWNKKALRSLFNKIALSLFLYELIFQFGSALILGSGSILFASEYLTMSLTGLLGLLSCFLMLGYRKTDIEQVRFRFRTYLWLLLLFYSCQLLSAVINAPITSFLHSLGFSLDFVEEAATGGNLSDSWNMFYTVLMAPLLEELLFRGMLFSSLRPLGKIFTILISSFLFAMTHANVLQFFPALTLGMLLAFIRERYGLPFSILLHMSNNAMVLLVHNFLGETDPLFYLYTAALLFSVPVGILSLVRSFRNIQAAIQKEASLGFLLRSFFSSVCVLILLLIFLALTVLNLS